jgi:hypothetical protein
MLPGRREPRLLACGEEGSISLPSVSLTDCIVGKLSHSPGSISFLAGSASAVVKTSICEIGGVSDLKGAGKERHNR